MTGAGAREQWALGARGAATRQPGAATRPGGPATIRPDLPTTRSCAQGLCTACARRLGQVGVLCTWLSYDSVFDPV